MQFSNHSGRAQRGGIVYLAVDAIAPSAVQPRQNFPPAQLEELSRSIAEYGVLSPLTVRPRPDGYELVAGERRLRAARMAGLSEVPCIVMELDLEEASFIALVENLQRNDLDFLEESRGAGLYPQPRPERRRDGRLIDRLLEAKAAPESERQKTFILKDVRVFLNTISHSLDLMKQGGIDAGMQRQETDDALILTINIPKARRREPDAQRGEPVPVG